MASAAEHEGVRAVGDETRVGRVGRVRGRGATEQRGRTLTLTLTHSPLPSPLPSPSPSPLTLTLTLTPTPAQVARRIMNQGILRGWTAWHNQWSVHVHQANLIKRAASRLAKPAMVTAYGLWRRSWEEAERKVITTLALWPYNLSPNTCTPCIL